MASISIRLARADDSAVIQQVEIRGGEQFRSIGMPEIADAEVESVEIFSAFAEDGRSWVAEDGDGSLIGFVLAEIVDDAAFIHQVTVEPARQDQGVGRALIDAVQEWAVRSGLRRLTLTTFDLHVPWNRPLYEHLGFRVISGTAVGPQLAAVQAEEEQRGLRYRVAMERPV